MSEASAEALGVVGPTARASGVPRDIRTEAPYVAYAEFPVALTVRHSGDLEARVLVRLLELFETYRVIRALLDNLPDGPLVARMPRRIPAGETISRVEAPRGELFYFIKSNGTDKPERIKVRTPTLCNMASAIHLAIGRYLADVPMLLAGIDPCFSCNDRAIMLRGPGFRCDDDVGAEFANTGSSFTDDDRPGGAARRTWRLVCLAERTGLRMD